MGSFSIAHWLIIFAILLVFFGPKRLPELGKGLGEAIRDFKKGIDSMDDSDSQKVAKKIPSSEEEKQS